MTRGPTRVVGRSITERAGKRMGMPMAGNEIAAVAGRRDGDNGAITIVGRVKRIDAIRTSWVRQGLVPSCSFGGQELTNSVWSEQADHFPNRELVASPRSGVLIVFRETKESDDHAASPFALAILISDDCLGLYSAKRKLQFAVPGFRTKLEAKLELTLHGEPSQNEEKAEVSFGLGAAYLATLHASATGQAQQETVRELLDLVWQAVLKERVQSMLRLLARTSNKTSGIAPMFWRDEPRDGDGDILPM